MSLTTRLAREELASWFEQTCPGVPNLAAAVYRRLRGAGPPVPARATEPGYQAEVDAAFTQRLGLLIDGSAPVAALLGPVRRRAGPTRLGGHCGRGVRPVAGCPPRSPAGSPRTADR
ncbi:hypothetical protein AB0J55_00280 [Amycolatopsis sp. NPDC049688]|uniref:hypothetical protein n=1 Tax=Amycolatopsis sp. NPDC049688 TaxID=3154733 RepID=UPI003415012D